MDDLIKNGNVRNDWTAEQVMKIHDLPLLELVYLAQTVHRNYHEEGTVQLASLLSIKTGACPEDCKYCPQSAHYAKKTGLKKESLIQVEEVLEKAKKAKDAGANRFCMGAAWKGVKDGEEFDRVIEMVKGVKDMGLEACVTLGTMNHEQAKRLKDAGLDAYNHNIDTSPEFYDKIITTRSFKDRIDTIENASKAGISVCSGGIIGMGETTFDRARMLQVLANMNPQPASVPINALVASPGTPFENLPRVTSVEMIRMVATARIVLPKSRVRLSAGRKYFNEETQLMCLMAGANSIFYGDKLLTTENNDTDEDINLIKSAGLKVETRKSYQTNH